MNLPSKITSFYHPTLVSTQSGRYAIVSGKWYEVDKDFTFEMLLDRWVRSEPAFMKNSNSQVISSKVKKWSIPNSKGSDFYLVTNDSRGWTCSCVGFSFRRDCKHIKQAKEK